jgi:DNA adenine methylase
MTDSNTALVYHQEPLSPPLKWAGGKRWLVPRLLAIYNHYRTHRLVEPFVGGMAVSLGLMPEEALLNDVNPHLINFYTHVKLGHIIDRDLLKNEREFYFSQRERFNALVRSGSHLSHEAASLFYYLNRTSFNGLCRFNKRGGFNVPFGKYAKIPYITDFSHYREQLSSWHFSCGDFEALDIGEHDFLYVDPPYDVEFTQYAKEDFTWEDQERLVRWLSAKHCPIVVSNQATDRILELYQKSGFTIEKVLAPRRISCNGDRQPAWEMLATKGLS